MASVSSRLVDDDVADGRSRRVLAVDGAGGCWSAPRSSPPPETGFDHSGVRRKLAGKHAGVNVGPVFDDSEHQFVERLQLLLLWRLQQLPWHYMSRWRPQYQSAQ
jgi:hypothetical protein